MDMKDQRFGVEVEMTGITREKAAEIAASYFGTTTHYDGTFYQTYSALDGQSRKWKFTYDSSITAQQKVGRSVVAASDDYKTEMVTPICRYEDIETIQELVRKLRSAGAIVNNKCGIHIHIDASPFDANTLRNITNIMAAKEDLIYKAMQVEVARERQYCRKV